MHIKNYIKHIKNEIMQASEYCCAAREYKKDGDSDSAQYMQKLATDGMSRIETLFKLLNHCIEKKEKEVGPQVYKELYEECIELLVDEHKSIEAKLKQG